MQLSLQPMRPKNIKISFNLDFTDKVKEDLYDRVRKYR